jgi:DNA polymerase I-like protein with 3'-5' exonuclease and polymerase domains
VPGPGHRFVIVDLSQIEPRCLALAAGDRAWLDLVRAGANPYEAHAMTAHGWKGRS